MLSRVRFAESVCLPLLLALAMSLAIRVPGACAQTTPNLWSIQLDGGMFVLNETGGANPMFGMRYSKHYSPNIMGGLLTGFAYRGSTLSAPLVDTQGESHLQLSRTGAHLLPIMGFMQVDLTEKAFLVPFVGIAAGYEWLGIHKEDLQTGQDSTVTYGNFAWQSYAGVGLRLRSRVRLNGELYYNGGSLERPVHTATERWHEAVHVSGVGLRVGLDMIFD